MLEDIIYPIIMIIVAVFWLKWVYKVEGGFFKKEKDLFNKSMTLRGWVGGLLILIVGICFLIKEILK